MPLLTSDQLVVLCQGASAPSISFWESVNTMEIGSLAHLENQLAVKQEVKTARRLTGQVQLKMNHPVLSIAARNF
ncbi:hypothetical protein [Pseudomonas sp. IT-P260]|uniref:hypothetical protein n=1 Tax=Pseudomonas sp. IT-P260 TaxID=3026457 RepID=UPI0039DFE115